MKLSISNLAWDFSENNIIFKSLKEHNINRIEGVLTKINSWENLTIEQIKNFKNILNEYDFKMESIQSIFYGITCEGLHDTEKIVNHIKKLILFCEILETKILVLGSPSLRKKIKNNQSQLSETFLNIDRILKNTNIELLIEPNTKSYGGEYFYNLNEIVNFIQKNNFCNINTMIDTHNLVLEGYDPSTEYIYYKNYIKHIHISEQNLLPITNIDLHKKFSETLRYDNYEHIITYEINKTDTFIDNVKNFVNLYQ
jgi:sugar phosphate isomerase/epimerase